jgi:hypothetical protein
MRRRSVWLCVPLALCAGLAWVAVARNSHARAEATPTPAPAPVSKDFLVAHEWGTFLAMSGSDGVSLDGMYHEEHSLPAFVHARSQDILKLPIALIKSETPVIYFYTNRKQPVHAEVWFRDGLWTQWFPQASHAAPREVKPGASLDKSYSYVIWDAEITPAAAGVPTPAPPETSSDSLWKHAREVDAAYVQTKNVTKTPPTLETERFLFYRGLGRAPLPLKVEAAKGGTISLDKAGKHGVRHIFTIRVEGGRAAYAYRPALSPGENASGVIPSMADARPIEEFVAKLGDDLAARLVESGLYPREARAMVNTWSDSYFRTEGIRTLFVLPQAWTDAFIPLKIHPKPEQTVRVMVGRVELLTPERERLAEASVRDLVSSNPETQLRGFNALRSQGRYVEPIVRRVLASAKDEATRALCRKLLVTEFVTDLRPTPPAPAGTTGYGCDPLSSQVQLAKLLHEIQPDTDSKPTPTARP